MTRQKLVLVGRAVIERGGKILLVRRAKDDPWSAGQWEFPGGKAEGNSTLKANLSRELREEIGLKAKIGKPFLIYDRPVAVGKFACRRYLVLYYLAEIINEHESPVLNEEHDAFKWVNPTRLPKNISLAPGTKEAIARYLKIKPA